MSTGFIKLLSIHTMAAVYVQTLTGALDRLQGRLASTGMQQQAKAVAEAKGSVVGAVSEAAEGVKNFVQASVHVHHNGGGVGGGSSLSATLMHVLLIVVESSVRSTSTTRA